MQTNALNFLFNATWSLQSHAEISVVYRSFLIKLPDDVLIKAFYDVFIADFIVEVLKSNTFKLTYDEYAYLEHQYFDIVRGVYTGEELIAMMLNKFETPAHFCHGFNTLIDNQQIFPWQNQRDLFLCCMISETL